MHCVRAFGVVVTLLTLRSAQSIRLPNEKSAQSLQMTANSFGAAQEAHMVRAWWDKWWHEQESMPRKEDASPEEQAKEWWDNNASDSFQHLDGQYVNHTAHSWKKFLVHFDWKGKSVLDYGIGGGYLGKQLFEEYGISHYTGIDISDKALDAAKANLAKYNNTANVKLALTPMQFSAVSPDIFVSQQVIQHFPSVDYFKQFLKNVDQSNANQVMLHFRASPNSTTYSTDAYSGDHQSTSIDVVFALLADKDFIAQHLKNYKFVWSDTIPMCCNTTGVYTGWDRK